MLVKDFFEKRYRPLRLAGKSSNTSRLYRLSIDSFGRTLGHPPCMTDLCDENIQIHMARVVDHGRSPATANKDRSQLLAIWRFAALEKNRKWMAATDQPIESLPDVSPFREPETTPTAWTFDEFRRIIAAAKLQCGDYGGVSAGRWWVALLLVCVDSAERINAILETEFDDLDATGWLRFKAENRKGKTRDKMSQLHPKTIEAIAAIRDPKRAKIFTWDYCDGYIWKIYRQILTRAGLPCDRRSKFHRIRRSVATWYHQEGGDAQTLLDHSSPITTRRYLDPRFTLPPQPASVLADKLHGDKK